MYVLLYNRLTGWLWFFVGVWSLFSNHLGDYLRIAPVEAYVTLGLGLLGMLGARLKSRDQVIVCAALCLANLSMLIVSQTPIGGPIFEPTPMENVLQFLCFGWGIFCIYHEMSAWVQRLRQQT